MKSLKTSTFVCTALLLQPLVLPTLASAQQSDAAVLQSNQNELLNSDLQQSAAARKTLTDILQQMTRVWRENSYQLSFVQILPSQVNSYQYQHVFADQRHYAQLSALDGVQQDIIQRDNIISYYGGSSYQPFSIRGDYILDNIPNVLYADYHQLQHYYDFIDAGKSRIAGRIAQVIRVLPKDDFRYQYILWIDELSHLLLRSDMLNRNSELLEQFRVITLQQTENAQPLVNLIERLNLPPLINIQGERTVNVDDWQLAWLPPGFKIVKREQYQTEIGSLHSLMLSDGLFSFSLYINSNIEENLGEHYWQQAGNTIYTETVDNREITLIGQIPLITAKQIVKDISFKASAK